MPYLFVIIQFGAIAVLGVNAFLGNLTPGTLAFLIVGWIIGVWAVYAMQKVSKVTVLPTLTKKSKLVLLGPYKAVRHPMYLSVLLFCLGLFGMNPNMLALGTYWILGVNLIAKILYEENLLAKNLPGYNVYKKGVKYRLIPWLW